MAMLPYSQLSEVGRIRRLRAVARSALAHYPLEVRRLRFVHRGRLTAFDFEDVMRGLPVQDIAITLSYGRERPEHRELRDAFQAGYERRRAWPVVYDGQLELLMAARKVMLVNYVLRTDPEPEDYIAHAMTELQGLLRTSAAG